jgi:putative transposase
MCRKQLRRQGRSWNHKRIYRVYKLMRLNLRRAAKRRLPKRERVALYVPRQPDTVWSADSVSDALSCGRRFRLFVVVDDFNREAIHIEVVRPVPSLQGVLSRVSQLPYGRTDSLAEPSVELDHPHPVLVRIHELPPGSPGSRPHPPGKSIKHQEVHLHAYDSVSEAKARLGRYIGFYNQRRPHRSLDGMTPDSVYFGSLPVLPVA